MSQAKRRRPETIHDADQDIEEILSAYDESFLDCRGINHPWRSVGLYWEDGLVCRLLVCPRCGAERVDRWRGDAQRVRSTYRNRPDGYEIRGHYVSPLSIRQEILRRSRVFDNYEAMTKWSTKARKRRNVS